MLKVVLFFGLIVGGQIQSMGIWRMITGQRQNSPSVTASRRQKRGDVEVKIDKKPLADIDIVPTQTEEGESEIADVVNKPEEESDTPTDKAESEIVTRDDGQGNIRIKLEVEIPQDKKCHDSGKRSSGVQKSPQVLQIGRRVNVIKSDKKVIQQNELDTDEDDTDSSPDSVESDPSPNFENDEANEDVPQTTSKVKTQAPPRGSFFDFGRSAKPRNIVPVGPAEDQNNTSVMDEDQSAEDVQAEEQGRRGGGKRSNKREKKASTVSLKQDSQDQDSTNDKQSDNPPEPLTKKGKTGDKDKKEIDKKKRDKKGKKESKKEQSAKGNTKEAKNKDGQNEGLKKSSTKEKKDKDKRPVKKKETNQKDKKGKKQKAKTSKSNKSTNKAKKGKNTANLKPKKTKTATKKSGKNSKKSKKK